jgi:hypothetical protein
VRAGFLSLGTLVSWLKSQRGLTLENLALRHQLIVLQRTAKKLRPKGRDRILWSFLSRVWGDWRRPADPRPGPGPLPAGTCSNVRAPLR